MRIVAHRSPRILEGELLARIAEAKSKDPLAPVLVIVPSRRLADHVMRRLSERFGALLAVTVVHHRALPERICEWEGVRLPPRLPEDLLEALFHRAVGRAPSGALRDFVRARPGAAGALRETLTDLREAGLTPDLVSATLAGSEPELARLYDRFTREIEDLARAGSAIDEAGVIRLAVPKAASFAARFALVVHHGAYDVIGERIELLRALDRGRELNYLLPADPGGESGAFGLARARGIAGAEVPIEQLDDTGTTATLGFFHAQGARAELQTAAYDALSAVASGVPAEDVAIVVRSFTPYAAALDALLDSPGPSWNTSYTRPLRRSPEAAAALRAIAEAGDGEPRRFGAHADAFAQAIRSVPGGDILTSLIESLRGMETMLGDERKVPAAEARAWIESRADATMVPPAGADGRGVRILDAMQARGLTFTQLNLAGMNSGVFPRIAREDPFLPDASRRRLREASGRPLPVSGESDGEERLLLAMLLHQSGSAVRVSWQRADETARPLVPSLSLRAIAPSAEKDARAIPAHPRSRLEAWAQAPGVLDPRDETLLAGLASELGARASQAVAKRRSELHHGIEMVAETESFAPTGGRYDARLGTSVLDGTIEATAYERLGRCPLQYFFRNVLDIEAPPAPATSFSEDVRAVGGRVHAVLQATFARLMAEGAFDDGDVDARIARGSAILREAWSETLADHPSTRAASLPELDRIEERNWLKTLDAFLAADLRRLADEGLVPQAVEHKVAAEIPGGTPGLTVRARFDRIVAGGGRTVIGDYKTGRKLESHVERTRMLSGQSLQVPLYALIGDAEVDLLGAGPRHDVPHLLFADFKPPTDRDGVLETLRVAAALAGAGRFPMHSGDHCARCDYRSACRHGHPPTEFREQLAEDATDARDCWRKSTKAVSLAAVRKADLT